MRRQLCTSALFMCVLILASFFLPPVSQAREGKKAGAGGASGSVEIVNPEGIVRIEPMKLTPHPSTLEGKTVLLRWNGKHNGDVFLNRIAELLTEKVPNIKIVRSWEISPETVNAISGSQERSMELMKMLASVKPDISIGSQAD